MRVTKYTIKADKVFLFTCVCERFTEESESGFRAWIMNYFANQYFGSGVSVFTKYEHPVLSAIAVIDINAGQEAAIEEIDVNV